MTYIELSLIKTIYIDSLSVVETQNRFICSQCLYPSFLQFFYMCFYLLLWRGRVKLHTKSFLFCNFLFSSPRDSEHSSCSYGVKSTVWSPWNRRDTRDECPGRRPRYTSLCVIVLSFRRAVFHLARFIRWSRQTEHCFLFAWARSLCGSEIYRCREQLL